jgi:uncharacterized membrane protein
MAEGSTLTLFVGRYEDLECAVADFETIREHRLENFTVTFDAAVVERDADGRVSIVKKYEVPTRMGGWTGFLVGAAIAAVFPPSALALSLAAATGAGAGALVGHFVAGFSRGELKEIGDVLEASDAAVVAVVTTEHATSVREGMARADDLIERQLSGRSSLDIDREISVIAAEGAPNAETTPEA